MPIHANAFPTILAVLAIGPVLGGQPVRAGLPGVIPEPGVYSESYAGDWASLPTGKELARRDPAGRTFTEVAGETARRAWTNQDEVRLADLSLRVSWQGLAEKMKTTLFTFRECRRVVIENVDTIQADPDHRGYDTIRIEDCDEVIVRNCHFGGSADSYHLRLDGCARVLIERVEIAGRDYGSGKPRCGGGIFIQNGATGRGGPRDNMLFTPNPRTLEWLVIQHCYIHGYLDSTGRKRNQDGILIHSPTQGIVFNCVVEDWDMAHGDAGMDVGFRRQDLTGAVFRIERNIMRNCTLNKSPGDAGHPSNALIWANNVFIGAFFGDYHGQWPLYHVHNTIVVDGPQPVYKLWGRNEGPVFFENCLVYGRGPASHQVVFQNDRGDPHRYRNLAFDRNVYLLPTPQAWVSGHGATVPTWEAWRAAENQDAHSILRPPEPCFVDLDGGDLRPIPGSVAVGAGGARFRQPDNPLLRVDRDFLGRPRPETPSAGAFEPAIPPPAGAGN